MVVPTVLAIAALRICRSCSGVPCAAVAAAAFWGSRVIIDRLRSRTWVNCPDNHPCTDLGDRNSRPRPRERARAGESDAMPRSARAPDGYPRSVLLSDRDIRTEIETGRVVLDPY